MAAQDEDCGRCYLRVSLALTIVIISISLALATRGVRCPLGCPPLRLGCDFTISALSLNKDAESFLCGAQPGLKAMSTGDPPWARVGAVCRVWGQADRAEPGASLVPSCLLPGALAPTFPPDSVYLCCAQAQWKAGCRFAYGVRPLSVNHRWTVSGLLALHFQPRALADEGLGPCGPLARGELT